MLLRSGNGFGGCCTEGVEDFGCDIAFEAAHDLVFRFALGEAAGEVVAGGLVALIPCCARDVLISHTTAPSVAELRLTVPENAGCSSEHPRATAGS